MLNKIFLLIITIAILTACGGTTHSLTTAEFSKTEICKVNSYYGCCGCEAKYFIVKKGRRKVEQIIYSYNCNGGGIPTKFIFNYNKIGHLISCEKYIATFDNDYTLKLTENEIKIFSTIDTSTMMKSKNNTIILLNIKGFRKPLDKDFPHLFPLIRKGYKLKVL